MGGNVKHTRWQLTPPLTQHTQRDAESCYRSQESVFHTLTHTHTHTHTQHTQRDAESCYRSQESVFHTLTHTCSLSLILSHCVTLRYSPCREHADKWTS